MKRLLVFGALVAAGLLGWMQRRGPEPSVVRVRSGEEPMLGAPQRGRLAYERYGCAMCHGADGTGGFANPNAETEGKVPGVLYVAEGYTAGELQRKLRDGLRTVGKADRKGPQPPYRMPGWGDQMTEEDTDDLVQYLLSLYPESAAEKWR